MNPRYICLIGPPGAGKDTILERLKYDKSFDFKMISAGDLLRERAKEDKEIRELLSSGCRVDDSLISSLLKTNIKNANTPLVFINGYPRSKGQAHTISNGEIVKADMFVFSLEAPDEILLNRLLDRKRGEDDKQEIILKRLKDYNETKNDIIRVLDNRKNVTVVKFDANVPVDELYKKFTEKLKDLK